MTRIYHAGNEIKYTGNSQVKYGGLFYEFLILDGYKKGQTGWTSKPPKEKEICICEIGHPYNNLACPVHGNTIPQIDCDHYFVPIGEYNQLGKFICVYCNVQK